MQIRIWVLNWLCCHMKILIIFLLYVYQVIGLETHLGNYGTKAFSKKLKISVILKILSILLLQEARVMWIPGDPDSDPDPKHSKKVQPVGC